MADRLNKGENKTQLPTLKKMQEGPMRQTQTPVHPMAVGSDDSGIAMKNVELSNHRLQVTNLPMHITDAQLNQLFPGNIGVTIKTTPRKGAKAVVAYATPEEFDKAFRDKRKLSMDGRPLVVSPKLRTGH